MPGSPTSPNNVWSLDFVHEASINGTKLKILALEAGVSFRSLRLHETLKGPFADRRAPQFLRSDNGPEFAARSLAVFLGQSGSHSQFIKPGYSQLSDQFRVLVLSPSVVIVVHVLIECCLDFFSAGGDFSVQQLISELFKEALHPAVLPGAGRLDEACPHSFRVLESPELKAVVSDDPRLPSADKEEPFQVSWDGRTRVVDASFQE